MSATDFSKGADIMKLEAEKAREQTMLNMAIARMAWADAKKHAARLEELDAELGAVRSDDGKPRNVVGRFRAEG